MKRIVFILNILFIIILELLLNFSYAYTKIYTLEFEALNVSEKFDLYLLLPESYIEFAIEEDDLDLEYNGVETLKNNDIPSIRVNKENINDELYVKDGVEYIQILLEANEDGIYEFDIISSYPQMDMKYRIKNMNKDYIVHIDNFKVENSVCIVEYDYKKDTVKQPSSGGISFETRLLIIVLIVIVVVGFITYIKKRR